MGFIDLFRKKEDKPLVVSEPVDDNVSTNEVLDEKENAEIATQENVEETAEKEVVKEAVVESYDMLQKELADAENEYDTIWNDCAYRGLPYNEMLAETENVRNRMVDLDERMRLIQEPKITYRKKGEKTAGDKFPLQEFIDLCNSGMIKNNDGNGVYASSKGISDIAIYPSDIIHGRYRQDFTHVIWFNK